MKRTKRSVTTVTETVTHKYKNGVTYREIIVDGKSVSVEFRRPDQRSKPFCNFHFTYCPELVEAAMKNPWHKVNVRQYSAPIGDIESFKDFKNVVCFRGGNDGTSWCVTGDLPLSVPYFCGYVGGYCVNEFDLEAMKPYLEQHPWVSDVSTTKIGYYNWDSCGATALEFNVTVPQRTHDKYAKIEMESGYKFWTIKLKDTFVGSATFLKDPLKLQKFRIADKLDD
jgi:hypothetical protein